MSVLPIPPETALNGSLSGAETLAVPLLPLLIVVLVWVIWARRFRRPHR
jgi:hypothetical protein